MAVLWLVLVGALAALAGLVAWGRRSDPTGDHPPGRPLQARDGTWVASEGERRIADWLHARGLAYRYEPTMADGLTPDFHLEGSRVVVEYWGMARHDECEDRMVAKLEQCEEHGVDVVSVFPAHLHDLDEQLERELGRRGLLDAAVDPGTDG